MKRFCLRPVKVLLFVIGLSGAVWADNYPKVSFTAELVEKDGIHFKYFVSPFGIRGELEAGEHSMIFIENFPKKIQWICAVKAKRCNESSIVGIKIDKFEDHEFEDGEDDSDGLLDFGEPCLRQGVTRKSLGTETVQGRKVEKFYCKTANGDESYEWYDKKLNLVIRSEDKDGVFELSNITERSIPRNMFEAPDGFLIFDSIY
jgi:hypothetical protein